jgi:hypothetical protein
MENPPEPGRSNPVKTTPSSFGDFKRQLIESVVGPVRDAILRSSWPVRAMVLGLLVSAGLLWRTAQSVDWNLLGDMSVAVRHRGALQLPTLEAAEVDQAILTLSPYLAGELHNAYNNPDNYTAWTVSQMTVALLGHKEADKNTVTTLLDKIRLANCNCWKVVSSAPFQDTASVNWVAFALAKLGQKLPSRDIKIILDNEHNGWWPAFRSAAADVEANASTYATAWSLLALNEQLRLGIEEPQRSEVQAKIALGEAWLVRNSEAGKARWPDYPNAGPTLGKEMIGISGLVVHVLHRLGADTRQIDAEWMSDLPADIPKPSDYDANPVFVTMPINNFVQDNARQLRLPWTIIATVDAYQNGTLSDRARANKWFRQFTNQIGPQVGPMMSNMTAWAASELTIALRYLRGGQHAGTNLV